MYSKKKKDLDGFLEELSKLQENYKIYISADYKDQLDEGMDGEWYSMGGSASIVYVDEDGYEIEDDIDVEWWIKEEKRKYLNKIVKCDNSLWTVKRVSWRDDEEVFEYYLEGDKGKSALVFEHNIELVNE